MGKKKDKRAKREQAASRDTAPLIGMAATLVRQLDTPAGRQVIAAGLMAAAAAIGGKSAASAGTALPGGRHDPAAPPIPPSPPKPAEAGGPYAGRTPEPPRGDEPVLPPEIAKVIGSVTAGIERWSAGFAMPKRTGSASEPPKG